MRRVPSATPARRRRRRFEPTARDTLQTLVHRIGRVAVEKNIEAFLDLDLPGTKVVVGPGPQLEELKENYPEVIFTGNKSGDELARHFADAANKPQEHEQQRFKKQPADAGQPPGFWLYACFKTQEP